MQFFSPPSDVILAPAEDSVHHAGHELPARHHGYVGRDKTTPLVGGGALGKVHGDRGGGQTWLE